MFASYVDASFTKAVTAASEFSGVIEHCHLLLRVSVPAIGFYFVRTR